MITIRLRDPVFTSTVQTSTFGEDNWGKVNTFDQILSGDPVGRGEVFEETALYRSFRQVFVEGQRWESTPFFRNLLRLLKKNGQIYRCNSREALLYRLENQVTRIWESMREHGYLSQADILDTLWRATPAAASLKPFQEADYHEPVTTNHEIKVALNEAGDLLFLDGRHRFAMARLLGVPEMPAHVVFRHNLWIQRRDCLKRLARTGAPERSDWVLDHPDLPPLAFSAEQMRKIQSDFMDAGWSLPRFVPELAS